MISELKAVIARDHHDRVVCETARRKPLEKATNLGVDERDAGVVAVNELSLRFAIQRQFCGQASVLAKQLP